MGMPPDPNFSKAFDNFMLSKATSILERLLLITLSTHRRVFRT